jgi:hypothetical protein
MQPNTIDEAFTLNDDTGIVFANGRFRTLAAACPSPRVQPTSVHGKLDRVRARITFADVSGAS